MALGIPPRASRWDKSERVVLYGRDLPLLLSALLRVWRSFPPVPLVPRLHSRTIGSGSSSCFFRGVCVSFPASLARSDQHASPWSHRTSSSAFWFTVVLGSHPLLYPLHGLGPVPHAVFQQNRSTTRDNVRVLIWCHGAMVPWPDDPGAKHACRVNTICCRTMALGKENTWFVPPGHYTTRYN